MSLAPVLRGDARRAVLHRGSHLQIIAAAGSGKTEVVAQRVADVLADGADPSQVVAFTFTERAAAELKDRIGVRVAERLGDDARDHLASLFVGTIHAYCFRLLQSHAPQFETYDVLDENRLTAFLTREATRLQIKTLDPSGRLFASIQRFLKDIDVVENELLDVAALDEPLRSVAHRYYEALDHYRLLTYGQQIVHAVEQLQLPQVRARVVGGLRHLIVDEYQDINPAQEKLIELLAGPGVELCVVGDDDQAIYQWRGSDVSNITSFARRYPDVASFTIAANYRSRPTIVATANAFARTIPGRLPKQMTAVRGHAAPEISLWSTEYEAGEADLIAEAIDELHTAGCAYRDIAVLARSRTAYPRLLEALASHRIPVQPAGRTGLFTQPPARLLGMTYCWLVDHDWRDSGWGATPIPLDDTQLREEYHVTFDLTTRTVNAVMRLLTTWKAAVAQNQRPVDLLGDYYQLLNTLGCASWNHNDPIVINTLGALARFSTLLADYESVQRRARPDRTEPGQQVGGQDRGLWYYKYLAIHLTNYANGTYEGFDGEPDVRLDAVDLTTIHGAKGLEWPVVFVPSLTRNRFPTRMTGRQQPWLVPRRMFDAARYEGSEADERRLFYVAITRARDWVSISRHDRPAKNAVAASPFFTDLTDHLDETDHPQLPSQPPVNDTAPEDSLTISFSELAAYDACGLGYRLRHLLGFQPALAPELGYGKAVHHILRTVAEHTTATGHIPTPSEIDDLLESDFYLPSANKPAFRQMKAAARRLITDCADHHADDLHRVWETERPFELHLDGALITGRADVILDREAGIDTALALVDYKTSAGPTGQHDLQLQVYACAGRREGLDVRAAYIHDLKAGTATSVSVSNTDLATAEAHVTELVSDLRVGRYRPSPGPQCRSCDVAPICRHQT